MTPDVTTEISKDKFAALLSMIVPKVVELIIQHHELPPLEATLSFYQSKLYTVLEQEDTKLWHFSPLTLYNMYDEEIKTGDFTFPEET